jgi:hypothetical protein
MARPTREHLNHTLGCVEQLFYDFPDEEAAWTTLYYLADFLLWVNVEIAAARQATGWGQGSQRSPLGGGGIATHTIGRHGLNRPVEDRLDWGTDPAEDYDELGEKAYRRQRGGEEQPPVEPADRLYQNLKRIRRNWYRDLGGKVRGMRNDAISAANWPHRTTDDDAVSGSPGS